MLDIAHAIIVVSQFMPNWEKYIFKQPYWILQWLEGTLEIWVLFKRGIELINEAYKNVDYIELVDSGSISSYCTFLDGNHVTWETKRKMQLQGQLQKLSSD